MKKSSALISQPVMCFECSQRDPKRSSRSAIWALRLAVAAWGCVLLMVAVAVVNSQNHESGSDILGLAITGLSMPLALSSIGLSTVALWSVWRQRAVMRGFKRAIAALLLSTMLFGFYAAAYFFYENLIREMDVRREATEVELPSP